MRTHKYFVKATSRAGDILVLTLAPRSSVSRLRFTAGQYATIGFIRRGRPTPMRCFSIVSTPASGVLQFAMRVNGNFTTAATGLQIGDSVRVRGPYGEFTLDETYDKQVVMLAGGIGITPFISIIRDATDRQLTVPITLAFSNRSAANIPFYPELQALQRRNPYLHIQLFTTSNSKTLSAARDKFHEYLQNLTQSSPSGTTYFVCGPGTMPEHVRRTLLGAGVDESRIVSESFTQTGAIAIGNRLSIRTLTYGLAAASLVLATGFIMALDLSRTVPKLTTAQHVSASAQTTSVQSTKSATATTPTTASTNSTVSSAPTRQQTTTYQPPVSSVS